MWFKDPHSLTHSLIHTLTLILTHSHSLTHLLTNPLTHSLNELQSTYKHGDEFTTINLHIMVCEAISIWYIIQQQDFCIFQMVT